MKKPLEPIGPEKIVYSGSIIDVINQDFQAGEKIKTFEIARRSPGVRIIIQNPENKLLITKEYRYESDSWDYRLPGGKVFDSKQERDEADTSKILEYAKEAAIKECSEETGLIAHDLELFCISHAGATVEWDLYYFLVKDFSISESGQDLESGEEITIGWYNFDEIKELVREGKIKEDRTLGVLFKYFLKKNIFY